MPRKIIYADGICESPDRLSVSIFVTGRWMDCGNIGQIWPILHVNTKMQILFKHFFFKQLLLPAL